jgi:hypothetical protein
VPLRPLGVGELLDGGFSTIRRYPLPTLGLTALVMLVVEVVRFIADYGFVHGVTNDLGDAARHGTTLVSSGDYLARLYTASLITTLVGLVAGLLVSGLMATVIGEGVLGRPLNTNAAWRRTRPELGRLLAASLLVFGISVGIVVLGCLPGVVVIAAGPNDAGIAVLVLGGLAAMVYALYVAISLSLAAPVVVLEKAPVVTALRRSRTLVAGSWWRVFGVILLAGIIASVVAGIIQIPFDATGGGLGSLVSGHPGDQYGFGPLLLSTAGGLIGATLVRPFTAGVLALLYVDRRMRVEALDLTLARAAAAPRP